MAGRILLIDDEEQLRKLLTRVISLEGFTVVEAANLKSANELLKQQPIDVILCDVRLPDGNGVDYVKSTKKKYPTIEIILLTAYGNIPDGVNAIKNGAFDYITKGDDNNRIIPLLSQAVDKSLSQQKSAVRVSDSTHFEFESIIGKSEVIKTAIHLARKIAASNSTILLLGETGTGKEVFANSIHHNSKRKGHPLIAINCSAFGKELLEGELFGYKAGAYTSAVKDKKGLVEIAEGGTLFLDEIGELHIDLQAKLLRLLENGEFIKLGDTKVSKSDIRIIAATNRHLLKEVEAGNFREDLYYRLNVFSIDLPSLRERPGDIPVLVHHFLEQMSVRDGNVEMSISDIAMNLLIQYSWKGNIRELKNVLERAVILVDQGGILPVHLPYEIQKQTASAAHELSLAAVEKHHIQKILEYSKGNKTQAARLLEIGIATLYRKIEEYNLTNSNSPQ